MHARPGGDDLLIDQSSGNPADHAIEFLVETVFHKQNAYPEEGVSHRRPPAQLHKTISFKLFSNNNTVPTPLLNYNLMSSCWPRTDENAYQFVIEINPPPPKA